MSSKRNRTQRMSAFDAEAPDNGASLEDVTNEIYGTSMGLDDGRVVLRPIALSEIERDYRQPRRLIPVDAIRETTVKSLQAWYRLIENEINFDPRLFIDGGVEQDDMRYDDERGIISEYVDLLKLARSIHAEGLKNPISVAQNRQQGTAKYMIETGERRFLAFNLLQFMYGSKYDKITARIVDESDVWAQASENGARRPLNAIGMARQLALLIMHMYEGEREFEPYALVDGSDRDFYAQVADGDEFRIRRGYAQRILDVTGLKSRVQISQYRALLRVSDDVWRIADENNWAERAIREYEQNNRKISQNIPNAGQNDDDTLTMVNISHENDMPYVPEDGVSVPVHSSQKPRKPAPTFTPGEQSPDLPETVQQPPVPPPITSPQPQQLAPETIELYERMEPSHNYLHGMQLLDLNLLLDLLIQITERKGHSTNMGRFDFIRLMSAREIQIQFEENGATPESFEQLGQDVLKEMDMYYGALKNDMRKLLTHINREAARIYQNADDNE